jgi:ankyrin repeat protein
MVRRHFIGLFAMTTLKRSDLLIRSGANVNAANRDGATPMYLACINGNASDIQLIKAGSIRMRRPVHGETPLAGSGPNPNYPL